MEGYRRKWGPPETQLLTPREEQILRLVAEGLDNQAIARCLGISICTVKIHLANIFEKLGVNRRREAVMAFSLQ
jgi:DNA-binding CsgD family transcriptional regulator